MKHEELTTEELVEKLQALVVEYGSQKEAARRLGVSLPFLHDVLLGRRRIGNVVPFKMGYEKKVSYVPLLDVRKRAT